MIYVIRSIVKYSSNQECHKFNTVLLILDKYWVLSYVILFKRQILVKEHFRLEKITSNKENMDRKHNPRCLMTTTPTIWAIMR